MSEAPEPEHEERKSDGIAAADALRVLIHRGSGAAGTEYRDVDAIARACRGGMPGSNLTTHASRLQETL